MRDGSTKSRPAAIEGDAYLLMQNGDTKRGAGRTIYLLRYEPALDSALAHMCQRWLDSGAKVVRHDEAIVDSFSLAISRPVLFDAISNRISGLDIKADELKIGLFSSARRLLMSYVADTSGTGIGAHYTFTGVKPGRYVLFSEWELGSNPYYWWAPVEVPAGQRLRRDLDNSVEGGPQPYCGERFVDRLSHPLKSR